MYAVSTMFGYHLKESTMKPYAGGNHLNRISQVKQSNDGDNIHGEIEDACPINEKPAPHWEEKRE